VFGCALLRSDLLTMTPFLEFLGWKSLLTIIEHLKDRTPKRGSDAGGLGALSKRVKSVNLGD